MNCSINQNQKTTIMSTVNFNVDQLKKGDIFETFGKNHQNFYDCEFIKADKTTVYAKIESGEEIQFFRPNVESNGRLFPRTITMEVATGNPYFENRHAVNLTFVKTLYKDIPQDSFFLHGRTDKTTGLRIIEPFSEYGLNKGERETLEKGGELYQYAYIVNDKAFTDRENKRQAEVKAEARKTEAGRKLEDARKALEEATKEFEKLNAEPKEVIKILFYKEGEVNHYEKFKMMADIITDEEIAPLFAPIKEDIKIDVSEQKKYAGYTFGAGRRLVIKKDSGITTNILELQKLITTDKNLNNISIKLFDKRHHRVIELLRTKLSKFSWSQSDTVCLLKHLLKYRIANCKPVIVKALEEAHGDKYEHFRG